MSASAAPSRPDDLTARTAAGSWSARGRRRRRSVRALVASSLLVLAATLVAVAAVSGAGTAWLTASGAAAVVLGAAAARITWSEVGATRRQAAYDRARQTEMFAAQSAERSAEHTAVVVGLGSRLQVAERDVVDLRTRLALTTERHARAEREAARLRARLQTAQSSVDTHGPSSETGPAELREELARVREALADARRVALSYRQQTETLQREIIRLQDALVERHAEQVDELASWQAAEAETEGVVRLATWGDRRHA